jgi:hypothetical protein
MPIVRFVYTGICALTPGYPRDGSTPATTLTAVLPQSRRGRLASNGTENIAAHFPFVFVPHDNLASTSRGPDALLTRASNSVEYAVIFLDREELTISPSPTNAIDDVIGTSPIGERPTTGNATDIRWAADFREIDPDHATLKSGVLASTSVNPHVAARVVMNGGLMFSRFPCPEAPSVTMLNSPETVHRQFAQEIAVEMTFGSTVTEVTLVSSSFDSSEVPTTDIVLQFIDAADIEVLIGNGPLESLFNLRDNDCSGHAHADSIDWEFEIYYDVIDFPANVDLPVPQLDPVEIRHVDCFSMFVD